MSATDTQVLAALNAWDAALDSYMSPEESLDDYEPGMVTAMRAALDAANLDLDRLRDGIFDLISAITASLSIPPSEDLAKRTQDETNSRMRTALRALLDGEAKG